MSKIETFDEKDINENEPEIEVTKLKFNKRRSNYSERGREHFEKQRPVVGGVYGNSRFNFPEEVLEAFPDHQLAFITITDDREERQDYVDNATDNGWWPLDASEAPSLAMRYCSDVIRTKDSSAAKYIKRGGQLAMKKPREEYDAEITHYNKMDQRQTEWAKGMRISDSSSRGTMRDGVGPQNYI